MPIVETYWQLADDEKEFLGFLDSTGRILSLPATWVESKRELIPQPIDQFVDQNDPDQLLFGFAEDVLRAGVDERDFGSGLRFAVPYMKPCLLSYNRGRFRNGKLTQSNLSGYMDYPNEDASTLLKKDPDFVHWVNKVVRWVRKATPKRVECNGHTYRATVRVNDAVSEGKLQVALY